MKVEVLKHDDQEVLITLEGQLDTAASQQFMNDIEPEIENAGRSFTLDFTNLKYIASSGLRVLLTLKKKAQEEGGSVSIVGMSENVLQIFRLVGFDRIFDIK